MTEAKVYDMKTIIVAGITRSGLTATMQMINSGGYPCLGEYPAFEPFLLGEIPWTEAKGKAVKLVDTHFHFPPKSNNYKVILLKRDPKQQIKSMTKFLRYCGFNINASTKDLKKSIKTDYKKIESWSKNYETLKHRFEDIIESPVESSERISKLIGVDMDVKKMANVIIKRSTACEKDMLELSMI